MPVHFQYKCVFQIFCPLLIKFTDVSSVSLYFIPYEEYDKVPFISLRKSNIVGPSLRFHFHREWVIFVYMKKEFNHI